MTLVYHSSVRLPANYDELPLGGLWPDPCPDVHGEQSAAAVEDGGQGRHEGSQHHSQHQTPQAWGGREVRGWCYNTLLFLDVIFSPFGMTVTTSLG